jgi:hypothetical protein
MRGSCFGFLCDDQPDDVYFAMRPECESCTNGRGHLVIPPSLISHVNSSSNPLHVQVLVLFVKGKNNKSSKMCTLPAVINEFLLLNTLIAGELSVPR